MKPLLIPFNRIDETAIEKDTHRLIFLDGQTGGLGLGQKQGKAVFSDGRQADYSNVFYLDGYRGRSATMTGYSKMVFSDDAWIFIKWDSRFTGLDDAGNPVLEGVGTLVKGTGPYQGIEGTVKFINRQLPPTRTTPRAPGRPRPP